MPDQITLPTRERILHIARDLVLSRGFSAMTIDMVCIKANITKGGLFHYFANKEILGEAVLQQFWQDVLDRQREIQPSQDASALEKFIAYLDHAITIYQDPHVSQGCMLAIFTMGLAETHPRLFEVSQAYFQQWRTELIDMLNAIASEQKLPTLDSNSWAELYIATLEGALVLAKSMNDTQVIKRTLTLYQQQLLAAIHHA